MLINAHFTVETLKMLYVSRQYAKNIMSLKELQEGPRSVLFFLMISEKEK